MEKRSRFNGFNIPNGHQAQIKFPLFCWEKGIELATPFSNDLPYDFIARGFDSLGFKTVQVKQSYAYKDGRERCDVRKKGPSNKKIGYSDGDFDILAAYSTVNDCWFIIPWESVKGISSEINLSSKKWSEYRVDY